ncbi:glycosyltransferase [Steroidobacter sp.]|uniref:glycosyltransferase n=1 Tax=Steroidobacter sp. TaxID=1978227 RepID=UPI001A60A0AB|nr:glycosyltransferase [Steroidobacter sp.]MBL8269728.1 glycosyltransferase [Steroidobacter sp.]
MNASATRISIIIPAFNEAQDLPGLLDSLAAIRNDDAFEVIVVDNGSTDCTANIARDRGANVVSIKRSPVGSGRNAGAKAARGELLAFLDADVIATPQWLAETRAIAERDREATITGDIYDIVEHPSWIERHWFGASYLRGARTYLNGGNLLISRADFAKVGGFNEQMISGEDVEFCERAAAAAIPIRPNRTLRVLHKGYPSTARRFIKREAWHGRSDFRSMRSFLASPVAISAAVFAAFHVVLITALIARIWWLAAGALTAITLLCLASAFWKWSCVAWKSRVVNAGVFYLYFTGRALAGGHELVDSVIGSRAELFFSAGSLLFLG